MKRSTLTKTQTRSWGYVFSFGVLVIAFIIFLLVSAVHIISREGIGKIEYIDVSGEEMILSGDIDSKVRSIVQQNCLVVTTCEYVYWFPRSRIQQKIQMEFPRIEKIELSTNYRDTIKIEIKERHLQYRYCHSDKTDDCFLVDSKGILYDSAPRVSDLRAIPTVRFKSPLAVTLPGTLPVQIFNSALSQELQAVTNIIEPLGRIYTIEISKRDMSVELDRLFDYSIAKDTAIIKFNRKTLHDPNSTEYVRVGLNRIESFKPFSDLFLNDPNSLEYLDVRFPKRIYMKFASEEAEQEVIEEGEL